MFSQYNKREQDLSKLFCGRTGDELGRKTWSWVSAFPWRPLVCHCFGWYLNNLPWNPTENCCRIHSPTGSENYWGFLQWKGSWNIIDDDLVTITRNETYWCKVRGKPSRWNKRKFPVISEQTEGSHQSYKSIYVSLSCCMTSLPGCTGVKNLPANAGDTRDARDAGVIPGWGKSPGVGNGDPLQYSCLENSMGRGAWWATVHRVAKSWRQLSAHTCLLPVALVVTLFIFY